MTLKLTGCFLGADHHQCPMLKVDGVLLHQCVVTAHDILAKRRISITFGSGSMLDNDELIDRRPYHANGTLCNSSLRTRPRIG